VVVGIAHLVLNLLLVILVHHTVWIHHHFKKDGSLDMRYSSSKEAAACGTPGSSYKSSSSYSGESISGLHYKKDGSLDMRYSSSKQAAGLSDNFCQMRVNDPSSDLHYKKDGSLDMRYRSSRQEAHGTSSGSKPVVQHKLSRIPDYVPKKKDGMPDMRTTAAKNWVAGEASACVTGALPAWVPTKKDGSVDLKTAIGRAFASHESRKVQHRDDY